MKENSLSICNFSKLNFKGVWFKKSDVLYNWIFTFFRLNFGLLSVRDVDEFHGMKVIDMGFAIGYKGIRNPMTNRITLQFNMKALRCILYCAISNTKTDVFPLSFKLKLLFATNSKSKFCKNNCSLIVFLQLFSWYFRLDTLLISTQPLT